jgi:hypothetical protein
LDVVRGAAEVTLNGKVDHVNENESIYLPIGSTHRLANPGKIDLELIEVQTGSFFGGGRHRSNRRHIQPLVTRWRQVGQTTPRVRRAIHGGNDICLLTRRSDMASIATARDSKSDNRMGPKDPRASLLTLENEAVILAYRCRTRLALNDAHLRLRALMPKLSRSALYRCLKRRGLSRIGPTATCPPLTTAAMRGPYIFEITAHEVVFHDPVLGLIFTVLRAVEEITKHVYAEVTAVTPENAAAFLASLVAQSPEKIIAVSTEMCLAFTDGIGIFDEDMAAVSPHPFAVACRAHRIAHNHSIPPHTKPPKIGSADVEVR